MSENTPASSVEDRQLGLTQGLMWARATLMQIARAQEGSRFLIEIARQDTPSHIGHEWSIPFHQQRADLQFCAVAARNLLRVVDFLDPPDDGDAPHLPRDLRRRIRLLRNCGEHWRPGAHAPGDFAEAFPEDDPSDIRWSRSDTALGGLRLSEVREHALALLEYFEQLAEGDFIWSGWPSVRPASTVERRIGGAA